MAEDAAERFGERTPLHFENETFTNLQILSWARRLQGSLVDLGIGAGDVVALCMINHPLVYGVFQGIFRTGATAVPVMFQLAVAELRFILVDTGAAGVITDEANLKKVREAVEGLEHVRWIAVRGAADSPATDSPASPPEYRLETLLENDEQRELPHIATDGVALMLYTSGTTGKPKGVMLSHGNLLASAEAGTEAGEVHLLETPRITISAMPMAHIFGVGVMNSGYLLPERLADGYMVQMTWFEPERFMQLLEQHRCTSMPAVPTMLALILNHPNVDRYDLSSLEEVVCGASPLPVEVAKAFMDRYGCRVREIYGLTESAGMGSANRASETYRPGSAGRAYCNTEIQIFDDKDRPVVSGQRGEIVLRGPSVMKGYHNRPEETANALRDGWLHTGDVGYVDDDGYLYIVDRKKDMIIRGGENIYPAEIEDILYQHPAIAEAAVVGIPDSVYGESIVAYVVFRPGEEATDKELIEFVRSKTSPFKAPSTVHVIDALPKSGVGKILRRELREKAGLEVSRSRGREAPPTKD